MGGASVASTVYCQSQRVVKRLAARRMSVGLVIANSSECNAADDRFTARPKGVKSPNAALQPLAICPILLRVCALPWTISWGSEIDNTRLTRH